MISAIEYLTVLEEKDLLPQDIIFTLYKQVAHSQNTLTAAELSQMLIDQGYLTPALANRLMGWNLTSFTEKKPESGRATSASSSHINLSKPITSGGSSLPMASRPESSTIPKKEKRGTNDDDLTFAPVQDEREPRPVIGKHRPYKTSDSSKTSGSSDVSKTEQPQMPKGPSTAKPAPSRWATSVYDQEVNSTKGIVSPALAKIAGTEQIPQNFILRRRTSWVKFLIRGGFLLGLLVLAYLLIAAIFFN